MTVVSRTCKTAARLLELLAASAKTSIEGRGRMMSPCMCPSLVSTAAMSRCRTSISLSALTPTAAIIHNNFIVNVCRTKHVCALHILVQCLINKWLGKAIHCIVIKWVIHTITVRVGRVSTQQRQENFSC